MSEYVNKDNTPIHEYITSPSLDPSEVVQADEHGVYPINPLGFPDTSFCADAHPVDAEGETVCIGKANAAYPQANQFSVESSWTGGILPARADMVEIGANVVSLEGQTITFPVVELNASTPGVANSYIVKVNGDISSAVKLSGLVSVSLTNAGFETYASTGLLGTATISGDSLFDGTNTLVYLSYTGCTVTGHIGAGRLNINISIIDPVKRYVLLTAQDNPAENGLYQIVDDGPWVRMSSVSRAIGTHGVSDSNPYENPASLDNSTLCGHVRHGYSDREVAERVERQAGVVIQNARHPIAEPGNLGGAGNLTRWFVECGPVVLGSSHGSGASVVVDGFGLGGYHSGVCTYGEACSHVNSGKVASDDSPVTTFSIGTSPTAGQSSLPRDWPFTTASDYAGTDKENNITLVKDYVTLSGSSTRVGGISKRVHICVNSNFSPSGDGTTRFKKTYVHLPAPIDTKDGEEFEVTVSLPTVNVNNAYHETVTVQDISAYYEYISQPRVVVMGGYWKFSNTEVEWDESRLHSARPDVTGQIDINGAGPFVDSNGNAVAAGTRIRFTLDGINNCPRFTDITGTLSTNVSGHIVISALDNYPYGARMRGLHMKICGIAYLDTANAEQNNFTDTPMGLHGRNSVTMGADTGNGEIGDLSQYNKFVTPLNANIEGKKSVNGIVNTDQVGDPRQILASVYPTVTNTFQWSLVGRHKMRKLDDLMTDEWDIGDDSVSAMIWDSNKKVIDFTDTVEFFGYGDEEYGFTADTMPTRYCKKNFGAGKSVIGSQLRIFVPDNGFTDATANPVRQACKAARMFADDFRKLRMYHGSTLPSVSDSSKIRTDDSDITSSLESYFSNSWSGTAPSDDVQNNSLAAAAWITKVRHLPEYIVTSGQVVTEDGNSIIGANPFVDSDTKGRYSGSFISEKYGNTEYGSSTATETVPCDVKLPGRNDAFAYRSVISAMVASDDEAVKSELYMDANRVAELQMVSIDHWKNGLSYNYMHPYGYLLDSSGYKKWMDIYSATANVFSIDTIPVPSVSDMPSGLDDRQLPMISSDPLSTYRKESNTNVDFAAANLPFYDESSPRSIALTNLLRNMVPAYGSRMPHLSPRRWPGKASMYLTPNSAVLSKASSKDTL